ncbi:ATP-binding cassette domain-containing protein [Paenibacillus sp. SYP-B3998]|uniref:ATP-binding cassette domain-containing protein n=1 Tax=Paenibacillus sp. SYP-B3998 TaxID=2678564 RepID=A0A6G4A125_9BACL|nr:ATP-binding cassette domain-containing protein [Paenibacillus sp. SYP-B3998]
MRIIVTPQMCGKTFYILRKHLLPFLWPLLRTKLILSFRQAVAMEASLSFLGIGDPNHPSWGKMLQLAFSSNETWLTESWQWTVIPPTLSILLVTIGLALLGEKTIPLSTMEKETGMKRKALTQAPAIVGLTGGAITADQLSVSYGNHTILQPVSFEITAGSVTALIGESGSGKTTLGRALYGLQPKESVIGTVLIGGKSIYGSGPKGTMKRW